MNTRPRHERVALHGPARVPGASAAAARVVAVLGVVFLAGSLDPARAQAPAADPAVTVETRAVAGRDVKEVRAKGVVDAPPHVVRAVIADVEGYPAFMPYVKESRLLGREPAGDVLNYQRLSFGVPLVSDRQYVIRIVERWYRGGAGRLSYVFTWRLESGLPADAAADAVVVPVDRGYWDLSPHQGSGSRTAVRYCVFTDPGGSLPKWLVPLANRDAVPKLFAAVGRAAKLARYAAATPPSTGTVVEGEHATGGCGESAPPPRP